MPHPVFRIILTSLALLTAAACGTSRSLDESFSDFGANAGLKGILFSDRSQDYSDIDITIYEGRLMLTGTLRSEDAREKLIENAWKADGVDQVIDEIFVGDKTPLGQGFNDGRIDQVLRTRLIASRTITNTDYKISVSGAVVYLIGAADSQNEIEEAARIASSVAGVDKVVSHVIVRGDLLAGQL